MEGVPLPSPRSALHSPFSTISYPATSSAGSSTVHSCRALNLPKFSTAFSPPQLAFATMFHTLELTSTPFMYINCHFLLYFLCSTIFLHFESLYVTKQKNELTSNTFDSGMSTEHYGCACPNAHAHSPSHVAIFFHLECDRVINVSHSQPRLISAFFSSALPTIHSQTRSTIAA